MRKIGVVAAALLAIEASACERDPQGGDCVCQPQTALETPFDNSSSTLGADNVQDALDELAARPLGGRVYFTDWLYADATEPGVGTGSECDDNMNDIPLSVNCEMAEGGTPDPTVILLLQNFGTNPGGGGIAAGGYCTWYTADRRPWGGRVRMRLVCMDPTP